MRAEQEALEALELVAREQGLNDIAAEAREASAALASRRFNVAVMGQFKRGKSTLINALLGREILPADVAPITTAITVVEYGSPERVAVRFEDGREEEIGVGQLRLFASEEENPGNRKGVRVVRIELPAPLLASGMRLVDTPGVGSIFESNSEVTRSFLPRVDVAAVVLGSDPPISGEELGLVRSAARIVGSMYFVLNKSDLVPERTRVKAEAFTRAALRDALGDTPLRFVHASALTALRIGSDPGVAKLIHNLSELAAASGGKLARASAARAARHFAARLLQELDLERAALISPVEDIDRRIAAFVTAMGDLDELAIAALARSKGALSYDRRQWETRREMFLEDARRGVSGALDQKVGELERTRRRQIREVVRDVARVHTRLSVERWHGFARAELRKVREYWVREASCEINRLIERVAEAASKAFDIPVARFEPEILAIDLQPVIFEFFEQVLFLDPRVVLVPLLDGLSSRKAVARRAAAQASRLAEEWVQRILCEEDQALIRWIDTLARQLDGAIQGRLDALRREVLDAVNAGRRRREEGETAVKERLEVLQRRRELVLQASALPDEA